METGRCCASKGLDGSRSCSSPAWSLDVPRTRQVFSVNRTPDHSLLRTWPASGQNIDSDREGVLQIVYRPSEAASGRCLFATIRQPLLPKGGCLLFDEEPSQRVTVWDNQGVELLSKALPRSSGSACLTPDGQECLFTSAREILAWNVDVRTIRNVRSLTESPATISRDCRLVAVRDFDDRRTRVRILRIDDGQELGSIDVRALVHAEFVDEDRRLGLMTSSFDGSDAEVIIWDYVAGQRTHAINPRLFRGAFSADGSRYAGEAEGHTVRIWDTDRGTPLFTTAPHSSHVWAIAFSRDGRYLATAGEGPSDGAFGEIRIWDAVTGSEVATIIDDSSWGVTALTFSPDGTELASSNGDGVVRFWKVPPARQSGSPSRR